MRSRIKAGSRSCVRVLFATTLLLVLLFRPSGVFAQAPAIQANAFIQRFHEEDVKAPECLVGGSLGNLSESKYRKPAPNMPYGKADFAIVKAMGPITPGSGPLDTLPDEAFHPDAVSMTSDSVRFAFWFYPESHKLEKDNTIQCYVFLERTTDSKRVWVPLAARDITKRLAVPPLLVTFVAPKLQPQLGFQAERLDGSKAGVAFRHPLKAEVPNVLKGSGKGRLMISTDSLLSLPVDDKAGHLNLVAAYRKTFFTGNPNLDFVRATVRTEALSNMAATDQSGAVALDLFMPVAFLTPDFGSVLRSPTRPYLTLTPVAYQDWWKKDVRAVPNHARDGLLYSRASLGFAPLYLFNRGTPGRTEAITFAADLTGYYFWNEQGTAGATPRKWLGAGQVSMIVPLKGNWNPKILGFTPGSVRPVLRVSYGRRINESANFAVYPNFSVTLDFLPLADPR